MIESNITQYEAREKYREDHIYYRYKKELGSEAVNPICDILCVGSEQDIAIFKKNYEVDDRYFQGVTYGVDWINPWRGAKLIRRLKV